MRKWINNNADNIINFLVLVLFIVTIGNAVCEYVKNKPVETKVHTITVTCDMGDCGETLPSAPMLFDEVDKFIIGKDVISIDYEVEHLSYSVIRTAVITYKE